MSVDELKLITEIFGKVTDGALIGGISYLIVSLIKSVVPWCIGGWAFTKLVERLPQVRKKSS